MVDPVSPLFEPDSRLLDGTLAAGDSRTEPKGPEYPAFVFSFSLPTIEWLNNQASDMHGLNLEDLAEANPLAAGVLVLDCDPRPDPRFEGGLVEVRKAFLNSALVVIETTTPSSESVPINPPNLREKFLAFIGLGPEGFYHDPATPLAVVDTHTFFIPPFWAETNQ